MDEFQQFLNFDDSDDDDDEDLAVPVVKKRRRDFVEPELLVDITPEKAVEEETSYQRVRGDHVVHMHLEDNKELLLRFLNGSQEFMTSHDRKDITAARKFIDHQVELLFLGDEHFSSEEKECLESVAENIVRILHRIQCRKFVLDQKVLYVPRGVDTFFVTARGKANEAQRKRITKENDKKLGTRVRGLVSNWLGIRIRRREPDQESASDQNRAGLNDDDDDTDDLIDDIILSMDNFAINTTRHCEFSEDPDFNAIQEDVLRRMVAVNLHQEVDNEPCVILSSPPRTPQASPPRSRSPSPERNVLPQWAEAVPQPKDEYTQALPPVQPTVHRDRDVLVPPRPEGLKSCLRTGTVARRNISIEVRPTMIQLYSRVSEEECSADIAWPNDGYLKKKKMYNDNGTTFWHDALSFSEGFKYLPKGSPFDSQAGSRFYTPGFVGKLEKYEGWNLLPVEFLLSLHRQDMWEFDPAGEAELALPAYSNLQKSLRFIKKKNKADRSTFFQEHVYERLCNFHSDWMGLHSIGEYKERFTREVYRNQLLWDMEPLYDKLILSDSVLGMCNPKTLLNAALLVCHPHIKHSDFVNHSFKFIKKLVTADVFSRRANDLTREMPTVLNESNAMYYDTNKDTTIYKKNLDFDVSGGVFLCFGHDILLYDSDIRDQWRSEHLRRNRRGHHPIYQNAQSTAFEIQNAALARCVALTNKVIYELKKLWEMEDRRNRPFPDIYLITIPEGRHGDLIGGFNEMLRKVVAVGEMFPVTVKLIDWAAVVSKTQQDGRHDMESTDAPDVEARLKLLFRFMRQNVDLRYRRTQAEREDAFNKSHRERIPGEYQERPLLA